MAKSPKAKISSLLSLIIALILGFIAARITEGNLPLTDQKAHRTHQLSVHFLDVGQADCQIILLPTGQTMIIDAGNGDDADFILEYMASLYIDRVDYLIGTHPHEDHIGSLDTIINNYEVDTVYMPDAFSDTQAYYDVMDAIEHTGTPLKLSSAPMTLYDDGELQIAFAAPVRAYDDLNNSSIVVRLTYKDSSFLFTGDAEEESENDIISNISADVLSVGHHGSSTSTSDRFLKRVDPMFAVISCGKNNDYGHPHWETIEKLNNDDITVYRTDKMGTIICRTNGVMGDYVWESTK